ncbi:DUF4148 domain-containing protein [Caballeronia sp. LP006]|uniref:DUF4148 domain-containing protein n=1 Tax=Caballeronia sp. LP006 TaxID=3038552 RepID=UPI002857AC18|nr:DUF4148 domain-containing protein [Caballeronia sp. LP006]MDR5832514.1 DUF4148 domain-containing protein [Caballeronia sp. LP006]
MKLMLLFAAFSVAMVIPSLSRAVDKEPLTREQVQAQLVALEQAGYKPSVDNEYPRNIQQAEAAVARQDVEKLSYGAVRNAVASSGK